MRPFIYANIIDTNVTIIVFRRTIVLIATIIPNCTSAIVFDRRNTDNCRATACNAKAVSFAVVCNIVWKNRVSNEDLTNSGGKCASIRGPVGAAINRVF